MDINTNLASTALQSFQWRCPTANLTNAERMEFIEIVSKALRVESAKRTALEEKLSAARDWIASNATKPVHDLLKYLTP